MRQFTTVSFLILTSLFSSISMAEVRSRTEFGLGVTSNANFEKENPDSDLFFKASTLNRVELGEHEVGLRLGYIGYRRETTNDMFSWRVSDRLSPTRSSWKFYSSLGGQSYPKGDPGNTDVSFDNLNLQLSAERTWELNSATAIVAGPSYELTYFTSFDDRADHTFSLASAIDHEVNSRLSIGARLDLGIVSSSQSDFSKTYFELGGFSDYAFAPRWTLAGEIAVRQSYFSDRVVSETTAVNKRRGVRTSSTSQEHESYSHLFLNGEAMRAVGKHVRLGGGLSLFSQSSRSGLQDYSAAELLARTLIVF